MKVWDRVDVDGRISFAEFEEYYKDLSASIDDDDYFELMIRNAWRMAGGKGAAANTANRRVLVTDKSGMFTLAYTLTFTCAYFYMPSYAFVYMFK